jgi:hypothetical protein
MSVSLICPSCAAAVEFHSAPATVCPRCGAALPDALRASVDATLWRQFSPRPLLLTIGMVGSGIVACLIPFLLVCAALNVGTYEINERAVSGPQFLRSAGAMFVVIAVICAAVSYGLATEKPWSRPLMVAYWPLTWLAMLVSFGRGGAAGAAQWACSAALAVLAMAIAAGYLYGKQNVQAYYRSLAPAV